MKWGMSEWKAVPVPYTDTRMNAFIVMFIRQKYGTFSSPGAARSGAYPNPKHTVLRDMESFLSGLP